MAMILLPKELQANSTPQIKIDPKKPLIVTNTIDSEPRPTPAKSIEEERNRTNWDTVKMHQFLEGSPEKSLEILKLYKSLERDTILQSSFEHYDNTKDQDRELVAQRINQMTKFIEIDSPKKFRRRLNLMTVYDPSMGIRIAVNLGLFLNCIRGNGTAAQYEFWAKHRESAIIKQMYGCFGMTELGHGSNVAGCETTATFDEETDEFVIDTPNISATKWWIGGAAHSATHSSVYARLIVKGKDYGVKCFIVPLRDSQHNLCPGVAIGDIGSKMGRQGVDNGWIQFSDVRIPRFFMLQKWCKVDRHGNVTLPPLEQLSYISLLGGRVDMAVDSYRQGARFMTIVLRYAAGRKQFKQEGAKVETTVLDYANVQKRLLPYLALVYAMAVGTDRLEKQHEQILEQMDRAILNNDKNGINQSLNSTKSLFVDSGSLKSTCTWLTSSLIDESRQACGGHGYSSYNGFGKTYNDWAVQCTWEGDNNVLGMSAGKTIVKNVQQILKGKTIKSSTLDFLNNAKQLLDTKNILATEADLKDSSKFRVALQAVIVKYAASLSDVLAKNKNNWDLVGALRVELSKLRAHYYLLETFEERVKSLSPASDLYPHLANLLQLYYVSVILIPFAADFIRFGVISSDLVYYATSEYFGTLCGAVRPYVVGLTDSFQQPDNFLNSAIGKYDGNIYENYFGVVKSAHPPRNDKAPYNSALTGMLNRPSQEERERFEKSAEAAKILSR